MKDRPILFSAPMVRAILAGKKTMTRRVVKLPEGISADDAKRWTIAPGKRDAWEFGTTANDGTVYAHSAVRCPFGASCDMLWVREAWRTVESLDELSPVQLAETVPIRYLADDAVRGKFREPVGRYRHGRFMCRHQSRITLEVTSVRVERLHAITDDDARAEGARRFDDIPDPHPYGQGARWSMFDPKSTDECLGSARWAFANAWNHVNGAESWDANPWVWCVAFRRLHPTAAEEGE